MVNNGKFDIGDDKTWEEYKGKVEGGDLSWVKGELVDRLVMMDGGGKGWWKGKGVQLERDREGGVEEPHSHGIFIISQDSRCYKMTKILPTLTAFRREFLIFCSENNQTSYS